MLQRKAMIPLYLLVFLAFTNITLVTNQSNGLNLMPICFALAVGALVAESRKAEQVWLPNYLPGETYLICLFLLVFLTMGLLEADLTLSLKEAIYPLLVNFLIFHLLLVGVRNRQEAEYLLLAIVLSAPIMFLQGVCVFFAQLASGLGGDIRASGWWQDPNTFAMIFNLIYLVSFYFIKKPQKLMLWAGRVAQATSIIAVLFSLSRGGMLIFLLITLMNWRVFWRYKDYSAWLAGLLVMLYLLVFQNILHLDIISHINLGRLFLSDSYHGDYSNGRWNAAVGGLFTYVRHPLTGVGFGNVLENMEKYAQVRMYTHNMFAELLATGGTLPFVAYVSMLGGLFYSAWSRLRGENRELALLLTQYIVVLTGTGFFAHYLLYLKPVWVLLALYPLLAQTKGDGQSEPDSHNSPLPSLHRGG